ncbi:hypothetical protein [Zobellia uliginosa]|uniref:hypothetical protein n=1 Tax=Zobellia uliginosa TaxID=143224 RepID=UPI0026E1E042|nr:hypothetical protein [Zobellia uliginosa]MDO6516312.1 hypothetical protein [Zobellia uliginosa]
MKTISKRGMFLYGSAMMLAFTYGCDKSNPLDPLGGCAGGGIWSQNILDETAALSVAGQAYQEDPTVENCAKYKAAAKDYLNALKGWADCVPGTNKAEYDQAIKEAKEDIDKDGCD